MCYVTSMTYFPRYYVQDNSMATASLIGGIAGFTFLPLLGSILAIITGHVALNQMKTQQYSNRGSAIAGLVIGYVALFGWLLLGVFLIVLMISSLSVAQHVQNGV